MYFELLIEELRLIELMRNPCDMSAHDWSVSVLICLPSNVAKHLCTKVSVGDKLSTLPSLWKPDQ